MQGGGGPNLRGLREQLGLTMRDVETATAKIAQRRQSDEFFVPLSRLSDIETKGIVPSIHRLYSLAVVYRRDMRDLLALFGVDIARAADDMDTCTPVKSHYSTTLSGASSVQMPVKFDPSFDPARTSNLGRMIEQWGVVPLSYLAQYARLSYTYGYIGMQDLTMYPLLPPGTFVQVDETRNRIVDGGWRTEYERPIYFVETRDSHVCCWCSLLGEDIILQSHPLSPVPARILKYPQQAEVLGQVVGVAIRLGEWRPVYDASTEPEAPEALN